MASSQYSEILEAGMDTSQPAGYLVPVIQRNLELARDMTPSMAVVKTSSSPAPSPPPSPRTFPSRMDLLNELGDRLSRNALMLSIFTENIIQGPHVDRLIRELHRQSQEETGLADIMTIAAEDINFTRLRKIRDLTAQFSRDVQAVWHPEAAASETLPPNHVLMSPSSESKASSTPRSLSLSGCEADMKPLKTRKLLHDGDLHIEEVSPQTNGSRSEDSEDDDDDDEQFQQIDMNALRQRGKGAYYCPKGRHCDKGGVDKEGNLVRFDRNSSFIQHCNKHRKPWRCELPGCPNPPKKRKFARRDGLERHKTTVKHGVTT